MAFKKFRKMKVYEASGYNYKRTPSIILKGDWLKETGFDIGGLIQVECENGAQIKKKYFKGKSPDEIMGVLEQALTTWFAREGK